MKSETNWTADSAQQEDFVTEVAPTIKHESYRFTRFYGVPMDCEDIGQDMWLKLCEQMSKRDPDGPFAKASPKEAADSIIANYKIREPIRSEARNLGKRQRRQNEILVRERKARQAEILAGVRDFDLPQDSVAPLLAAARSIPVMAETSNLSSRESEAFRKELLRQIDLEGLPASVFDQATRAAGVSSSEQREYNEYHDKNGHSSPRDRKALSRAFAKVKKAFPRAKLLSLLMIVLALSLALSVHQGRSIHQKDFVNQDSFTHKNDLAHQNSLIYQKRARRHQSGLVNQQLRSDGVSQI